jgi:hypothetical protein
MRSNAVEALEVATSSLLGVGLAQLAVDELTWPLVLQDREP